MKKCKYCGHEMEIDKVICENCGWGEKNKKIKKIKGNKAKHKKVIISSIIFVAIVTMGIVAGIIINFQSYSFERKIDELINSGKNEVIFLERNGDAKSNLVKNVLDNELKEQGIEYTTINVTDLSNKQIGYLAEKHILNDNVTVYLKVINGGTDITSISSNEVAKDTIMYYFARKNLLKDNEKILNERFYNIGKSALENGNLGRAKENLDKCRGYLDTNELLNDRRFLLLDHEFEYKLENISYGGRNINVSFSYNGGSDYTEDWISVYFWDCIAPYGCLYSSGNYSSFDAQILSVDRINTRPFQSSDSVPFSNFLNIEILSESQIRINIEGTNYTLNKTS